MMNNINKIVFMLLFVVFPLFAQQSDTMKKEINKIKKSSFYIYAETTMPDKEDAKVVAMELLQKEVKEWANKRKRNKDSDLLLVDVGNQIGKIELPRGNMYRAFVYVKKSDVIVRKENTTITNINRSSAGEIKQKEETRTLSKKCVDIEVPKVVEQLLTLKQYDEVPACLERLEKEGLIVEYGRYASLNHPEDYVLIIYNRQAKVETILSEGKQRINYRTKSLDGVQNYKGRGAIGVKIRK